MINIDYRKLIAAVIKQAVKDNAAWFLESDLCKGYCAAIGINHTWLSACISYNAGSVRQGGENA
jgi:hypothetical protein